MPKSKRQRIVHTSAVQKKPSKEKAQKLFAEVRTALDEYQHVVVFTVDNMRNNYLKGVRQHFSDSRIFYGKTKVMAKALGSTVENEYMPGLADLAKELRGDVGLLCTNQTQSEVLEFFGEFSETDFARAGARASSTFAVPAGVVCSTAGQQPVEDDVPLPHSLEAQVRKWGMPTRLDKGKVMLDQEYVVCEEGKVLDSNQTALLKCFGVHMAEFRVRALAGWSAATGEVTVLQTNGDVANGGAEVDDEDMERD